MSNILRVLKVAAVRGGAGVGAQVQVCVWVQCVDGVAWAGHGRLAILQAAQGGYEVNTQIQVSHVEVDWAGYEVSKILRVVKVAAAQGGARVCI